MKYTNFYNSKSSTSSNSSVATVSAGSAASNGSYDIKVSQIAKGEMQVVNVKGKDIQLTAGEHEFYTYDDKGVK